MKRLATFAACLGVIPGTVRAQDWVVPPTKIPTVAVPATTGTTKPSLSTSAQGATVPTLPGTTVPAVQFPSSFYPKLSPSPAIQVLSADEGGTPLASGPRAGWTDRMNPLTWFGHSDCDSGACPICGTKRQHALKSHKTTCDGDGDCGHGHSGKFKEWFCYNPNYVKTMPCFRPVPYRAPLIAWFGYQCREPQFTTAPNCGPGGCANGACATPPAAAPAGPVPVAAPAPAPAPVVSSAKTSWLSGMFDSLRPGRKTTTTEVIATPAATQVPLPVPVPGLRYANPIVPAPQSGSAKATGLPALPTVQPAASGGTTLQVTPALSVTRPFSSQQ